MHQTNNQTLTFKAIIGEHYFLWNTLGCFFPKLSIIIIKVIQEKILIVIIPMLLLILIMIILQSITVKFIKD